jgi:uncharacterized protein (DUF885 family)
MKISILIGVSLVAAAHLAGAQTTRKDAVARQNQAKSQVQSSHTFSTLADRFVKESLALSPVSASYAGYHKHPGKKPGETIELDALLDDVSAAGFAEQRRFYAEWRDRFQKEAPVKSLDVQDAADFRLIDDQIERNLLELDKIENYKHNPTVFVELLGNGLFLPLSQEYAPKETRVGHVLSRIEQIPRFVEQAKQVLVDADPIFIKVAGEENEGNVELVEKTVPAEIAAGSPLKERYDRVAPPAVAALRGFNRWMQDDLGKRPTQRTWRLGKEWYDAKFKLVMETPITPEQILADAEREMAEVRAEMLRLATPLHKEMYPDHADHSDVSGTERENLVIGEVLRKISDDHPKRDQLMDAVKKDLDAITAFIRDKKIVSLSARQNLKVIPTPPFMRGIYSVAGFAGPPPLEPTAEAQYWVTPIDPSVPDQKAESKLREYNDWVLKWLTIHEALPGHYVQYEHANDVQPPSRRVLRSLFGNGAYVEGWAEYIAQVMMDAGFADNDPRFRLSMRKLRLRLLANAILDVRMQTMGMTDEQAMELMTRQAFQTQAEAEGKLQRAKLSSTQLPTYYVGLRAWQELRKKYETRKGKDFDMLAYHDLVLNQGALPFDALEAIVMGRP